DAPSTNRIPGQKPPTIELSGVNNSANPIRKTPPAARSAFAFETISQTPAFWILLSSSITHAASKSCNVKRRRKPTHGIMKQEKSVQCCTQVAQAQGGAAMPMNNNKRRTPLRRQRRAKHQNLND